MLGRKEVIDPAPDTWLVVHELKEKFLSQEHFISSHGTMRGIPNESELREFTMTISLSGVDLPNSIRDWCRPGSRPAVKIAKRLKDLQDPALGWEVVMDRIASLRGRVDEQVGSYERLAIDLSDGALTLFSREYPSLQRGKRAMDAYERLLSDLFTIKRHSLVYASFVVRSSSERYRLII